MVTLLAHRFCAVDVDCSNRLCLVRRMWRRRVERESSDWSLKGKRQARNQNVVVCVDLE